MDTDPDFTIRQREMIDKCKATGYGWGLFAASVESQGTCSLKQEETLYSMCLKIDRAVDRKAAPRTHRSYGAEHDISDNEAARSHDYF